MSGIPLTGRRQILSAVCPLAILVAALPALGQLPPRPNPEEVFLAANGKARLAVTVAPKAPERVRQAARTLADYLGRMSGATFEVGEGRGRQGIAVGLCT